MRGAQIAIRVVAVILFSAAFSLANGDVVRLPNQADLPGLEKYEIRGGITKKDVPLVRAIVERAKKNRGSLFIELNSKGGDLDAAIEIGRQLRGVTTIALVAGSNECLSACVFILAGATQRGVSPYATIGIHRPYSLRTDVVDYDVAQANHRRTTLAAKTYLQDMKLPASLYDAMMLVPPESIRVLQREELASFGLDQTDPVQQELFDNSEAREYGLDKVEYLRRKNEVSNECARERSILQRTGDGDKWLQCKQRIMRRR